MNESYVTALPGIHLVNAYSDDPDGAESKHLVPSFKFGNDLVFASSHAASQKLSKGNREIVDALPGKFTIPNSGKRTPPHNFPIVISKKTRKGFKLAHRPDIVEILLLLTNRDRFIVHEPAFIASFRHNGSIVVEIQTDFGCDFGTEVFKDFRMSVGYPSYLSLDTRRDSMVLIEVLEKIRDHNKQRYLNILNSIRLFNQAISVSFSGHQAAVVLFASAYEALFETPRMSKKENFSNVFKLLYGFDDAITQWSSDFYDLRSRIVHGAHVDDKDFGAGQHGHLDYNYIAGTIYFDTLLFILDSMGFISVDLKHRKERVFRAKNFAKSNKEKIAHILSVSSRKRFTAASISKDKDLYFGFLARIHSLSAFDNTGDAAVGELIEFSSKLAKDVLSNAGISDSTRIPVQDGIDDALKDLATRDRMGQAKATSKLRDIHRLYFTGYKNDMWDSLDYTPMEFCGLVLSRMANFW